MDIKGKIEEIVNKVKNDGEFKSKFQSDPISAVESVVGVDLPNDQIKSIAEGVKAKIGLGSIGDKLGGLFGK